jgi:hypothetical protein
MVNTTLAQPPHYSRIDMGLNGSLLCIQQRAGRMTEKCTQQEFYDLPRNCSVQFLNSELIHLTLPSQKQKV